MKKCMIFVLCAGVSFLSDTLLAGGQKTVISVPVTTLWECELPPETFLGTKQPPLMSIDLPGISTQLLFGERVEIVEVQGDWSFVRALEQPCYNRKTGALEYLQGWVNTSHLFSLKTEFGHHMSVTSLWAPVYKNHCKQGKGDAFMHLSMGTLVRVELSFSPDCYGLSLGGLIKGFISKDSVSSISPVVEKNSVETETMRSSVIEFAQKFVDTGSPYCWGGRCAWNNENFDEVKDVVGTVTSVDCSGLVNIVYRACGLLIPRNAHDQMLFADKIDPISLQKGDLVFLINPKNMRARHVILYVGLSNDKEYLIEATGADRVERKGCRRISVQELFGVPSLQYLKNGDVVTTSTQSIIQYGSILGNFDKVCAARSALLFID